MDVSAKFTPAKYKTFGGRDKDGFTELQFKRLTKRKVPYRAILTAVILFVVGSVLLIIGALLFTGYISAKYSDRTWPVIILGSVLFIPGAYHVRIAFWSWRGYKGFSYEDIPSYYDD